MIDIITETLIDGIKLLPFLFFTFIIMEYFEHKTNNKSGTLLKKATKCGPFLGSLLGAVPQCGFSVMATNFYAIRAISLGTLISIYLSTSDEMIPLLISKQVEVSLILNIIFIKIAVGMIFGFLIDLVLKKKEAIHITDFCQESNCDCSHSILKSSIVHTIQIFMFILIITLCLNIFFEVFGNETLSHILMRDSIFGPFITCLIGLIPNCAASVAITELYLNNAISFASLISGLLTGSGVSLAVLFKVNKNIRENIRILALLYSLGVLIGLFIQLF